MKNQLPHRSESPLNNESDEELAPPSNGSSTVSRGRNRIVPFPNQVRGKKGSIDLMECVDSTPVDQRSLDEFCLYNLVQMGTIPGTRRKLIEKDYAVMKFWNDRKTALPTLFAVAARIFAKPVSSAASERVFSALKLVVHDKSSRLTNKTIEDIIVIRSLYEDAKKHQKMNEISHALNFDIIVIDLIILHKNHDFLLYEYQT